jgi:hypothetical protein
LKPLTDEKRKNPFALLSFFVPSLKLVRLLPFFLISFMLPPSANLPLSLSPSRSRDMYIPIDISYSHIERVEGESRGMEA